MIRTTDLTIPELSIYNCRSETTLFRYNEPEPGLFIAESAKVIERALKAGYRAVSCLVEEDIRILPESEYPLVSELISGDSVPVFAAPYSQRERGAYSRRLRRCLRSTFWQEHRGSLFWKM